MPHNPVPETLPVSLTFSTWLTVEAALKEQRYQMQRWLARKTEVSESYRAQKQRDIDAVTTAINKIIDQTASV